MNDPGTRESLREMVEVLFLTKEQRGMALLLRCRHCHAAFRAPRAGRPPWGCSPACQAAIKKARRVLYNARYKSKTFLRQCDWCYQLMEVSYGKPKKRFCNQFCSTQQHTWLRAVTGVVPVAIKERVLQLLEAA